MVARRSVARAGLLVALVVPVLVVGQSAPVAAVDVATVSCAPAPPGPAPADTAVTSFTPIAPRRLVDTRSGVGGVAERLGAGCVLQLDVRAAAVPDEAQAVALSLTAISTTRGFLTVFPCSGGLLATSNLNTREGFPTANLAVARPDADRRVCIFSDTETHLIVDTTGWWTAGGTDRAATVEPDRVEDTRTRPGRPRVPADTIHVIDLADDVPPGTTAITANLTIASPVDRGFATAFPCGTSTPDASNVNFRAGEARAAAVVVGVDAARRLCVQTSVDAHVILDLTGYYADELFGPTISVRPVPGIRVADSRDGTGGWSGPFQAEAVRRVAPVAGQPDAARATAVVANVTAVRADSAGFVEVYPCGASDPETSVVNYGPEGASSNLAVVELGTNGELCVVTSSSVDVIVDLFAVLSPPDGALVEQLSFASETWPPFTVGGGDYAVRCDDDHRLELDVLPGTTARVNNVPVVPGSIALTGADHTLTRVQLRRDGTVEDHWFRCVPDDMPRVDVERSGPTTPGWYLTMLYEPGEANSYATIMDARGAPVWYQATDPMSIELRLRDDGLFVGVAQLGPRYGVDPDAGYEVFTLTGDVVRTIVTVDENGVEHPTDHHDIVDLSGGGSAVLTYPLLPDVPDLASIGFPGETTIADNVIQELGPSGDLLWSWRASDHFEVEEATFAQQFPPVPGWYEGDEIDVWHLNSLDRLPDGDYVASARHLDAVFRIDRDTDEVEWVLGPPLTDQMMTGLDPTRVQELRDRRLTIVDDPLGGPRRPHDARLAGNVLTMLDNRTATNQPARVVGYEIDPVAGTATMLWSITTASGSSSFGLGSARVAGDGSTLVSWGNGPVPLYEEFDAGRQSVLRFFQDGGYSYRITKEPLSAFSAAVLRATAGGTIG